MAQLVEEGNGKNKADDLHSLEHIKISSKLKLE